MMNWAQHFCLLAAIAATAIIAKVCFVRPIKRRIRQSITLSILALIILVPMTTWWANTTDKRYQTVKNDITKLEKQFRDVSKKYAALKSEARNEASKTEPFEDPFYNYSQGFSEFEWDLRGLVEKRNQILKKANLWHNARWICHPDYEVSTMVEPCDISTEVLANPFKKSP